MIKLDSTIALSVLDLASVREGGTVAESFRNTLREYFKPSAELAQPYVMVGVPVLAADTDEQAEHLATSARQRILRLIRGQPIFTPPPAPRMDGLWNAAEQRAVETHLDVAVIGGPETVERKLREFLQLTQANELILHSDFYRMEDRRHSYEVVASLFLSPTGDNWV